MKARSRKADALSGTVRASIVLWFATVALTTLPAGGGTPPKNVPTTFLKGAAPSPSHKPRYVEGDVLVKFKSSAPQSVRGQARAELGARRLRQFKSRAEQWRLGRGRSTVEAIERLRRNPAVEYAEPDYIVEAALAPADPSYPLLWGLHNIGQTGGVPGADIGAEAAWTITVGDRSVLVGVLDSGIDYYHPDLRDNIWTNPGEIPGNNLDDDHNGFVDDVHGWDFVSDDGDPMDDFGHGTHVAGTIGALGDNDQGVVGVAWRVSLVPLKFLNASGNGSTSDAVAAINYAIDIGVDVLNNSWGSYDVSQTLMDAIRDAEASNIVFVCAAGNNGSNNDVLPFYPASYAIGNVISVAATDNTDRKAVFSNYGFGSVDLGAPGVDIFSTLPQAHYGSLSGTSMAAPHVSGVAALLRAIAPDMPVSEVRQKILDGAVRLSGLTGLVATGGRLSAFFPMATRDDVPPGPITDLTTVVSTSNSIVLRWTATGDDGETGQALTYDVRYSTAPITEETFGQASRASGTPPPSLPGSQETMEVVGLSADTSYFFAVKALDEWGNAGLFGAVTSGTTLPPPTFDSTPTSFSFALRTGETASQSLSIRNAGQGTLDWSIPTPTVSGPGAVSQEVAAAAAVPGRAEGSPGPSPMVSGPGGPDAFGYRFIDSDQPGGPQFSFEDLTQSGRGVPIDSLSTDDQISEAIPLGFAFSFYGQTYDSVRVSTNGFLTFLGNSAPYDNKPLPNASAPPALVAPFWDDLKFQPGFGATYARDPDSFTVQFTRVLPYSATGSYTFQATRYHSGESVFRYLTMDGGVGSATIGIQDASQSTGLQVAFNSPYLHPGMAIRIYNIPQWLQTAPTSGRLAAGEGRDVSLEIDAAGLEGGTYAGTAFVQTNDPLRPIVPHTVTLVVTPAPMIEANPGTLDFRTVFSSFSRTPPLRVRNSATAVLHVTGIASSDPAVTVSPSTFDIPVRGTQDVAVTYRPPSAGVLDASLTVSSDAANAPVRQVRLLGTSSPPPQMIVSPLSFNATLLTGSSTTRTLHVVNRGGSPLVVNVVADFTGAISWLSVAPVSAIIPPSPPPPAPESFQDFTVTIDAGDFGTTTRNGNIVVGSNIPGDPVLVPVTLSVTGAPNIAISDEPVVIESQQNYNIYGASTTHRLPITYATGAGATVEVIANGNFNDGNEYADVRIEGLFMGRVGSSGRDCLPVSRSFPLDAGQMAAMTADGVLEVVIKNTDYVNTYCPVNRHTVRLSYMAARDLLDFGSVFLGVRRSLSVPIHNRGSEVLKINSITSDKSDFAPSTTTLNVPPLSTAALTVSFAPTTATLSTATLTINSNDPDTPAITIALRGTGLPGPVIDASPTQFSTTLFKKMRESHALTLSNSGGSTLDFSVNLKLRTPPADPAACAPLAYVSEWGAGRLSVVNLDTGVTSPIAFGLRTPQENLVLDPGGTIGYVAESDPGNLAAIDLTNGLVTRVAGGFDFPVGVALTITGETAYISEAPDIVGTDTSGRITALNLSTGERTTVASGLGAPNGLALNSSETTLYFNERSTGKFSKVDLGSHQVTTILTGLSGPNSVALNRDETKAYVTETIGGNLWSIDLATGAAQILRQGLLDPQGLALSVDGKTAYVVEFHKDSLAMIDLATQQPVRRGLGLSGPAGVAVVTPGSCRSDFLTVNPAAGSIPPGASLDLDVEYDSSDLFGGTYQTDIEIQSNDPATPILRVPATLMVNPICLDGDGDGYAVCTSACALTGNSRCGDCDDADPALRPFVPETCNGRDDNCNGLVDESILSADADSDLIGDLCDNCQVVWNPAQEDADANG